MRWFPWNDYEKKAPVVIDEIKEPPCKDCKDFNPRITTDRKGTFNGVVICTADSMHHDFSCFLARETK